MSGQTSGQEKGSITQWFGASSAKDKHGGHHINCEVSQVAKSHAVLSHLQEVLTVKIR